MKDARFRKWMESFPTEEESVRRAVEAYRGATREEIGWAVAQACLLAEAQARAHPDPESVFRRQTPRSPESEKLWLKLVEEARRARTGR